MAEGGGGAAVAVAPNASSSRRSVGRGSVRSMKSGGNRSNPNAVGDSSTGLPGDGYDDLDRDTLLERLRERDEKITSLERTRLKQDEAAALLRSELGAVQIRHKEECYWLRLEVDNLRKDKEAVEDRMAELYRDMREIDNMNEELEAMGGGHGQQPASVDSGYVLHLQSQLSKSMQTMGVLDNQIGMVKRSCDEVVKSLKEEIADVMDDKCRVEMELLNQLAVLDNERKNLEDDFEERLRVERSKLKCREEHVSKLKEEGRDLRGKVATLQKQLQRAAAAQSAEDGAGTETGEDPREREERINRSVGDAMASASAFGGEEKGAQQQQQSTEREAGLARQVDELRREVETLEERLAEEERREGEGSPSDDRILDLEDTVADQEDQIERLSDELDALRRSSADEAEAILTAVQRDRDEALETLDRVAEYWEKADESIQVLEDVMEQLRPSEEGAEAEEGGESSMSGQRIKDRYRTLSTLETATLVHSQIKVSLLLVELKCRNQLTTLRNDVRLTTGVEGGGGAKAGGPASAMAIEEALEEISDKIDGVESEGMAALQQVEANMTGLIQSLEGGEEFEAEAEELRAELGERIDKMIALQEKYAKLETDADALRRKNKELEAERRALGLRGGGAGAAKGKAAGSDGGAAAAAEAEKLRKDLERVEEKCEDLAKEKEGLERTRRELEKTNLELEQSREEMMEDVSRYKKDAKDARVAMKEVAKRAASDKAAAASSSSASGGGGGGNGMDPAAQQQMFEMLQKEIFAVVGKIKDKNEEIGKLTAAAEEHKVREAALKKELKRIMKRVRAIEEGDRLH